jgi:hypothetical protein
VVLVQDLILIGHGHHIVVAPCGRFGTASNPSSLLLRRKLPGPDGRTCSHGAARDEPRYSVSVELERADGAAGLENLNGPYRLRDVWAAGRAPAHLQAAARDEYSGSVPVELELARTPDGPAGSGPRRVLSASGT